MFFNFVLNALQGICLKVSFAVVDSDMCSLLTVLAGMFTIDCVLCITVSQLFPCVLVPCVSNWCEETVTVICPEVTMCNGPVLIWLIQDI